MKLTEKVNSLLEVKSKYTYCIFENGNGEMTVEVQLTEDFKKVSFNNFAIATTSKENFERCITVDYLNRLFNILRHNIQEHGRYATIEQTICPAGNSLIARP